MGAVLVKELRHAANSQIALITVLVFVIAPALPVFWSNGNANVFLLGQADLRAFFAMMPMFSMVLVPALTMRSWAEERGRGTLELLHAFPVSSSALVWGKLVAVWLICAACLLGTLSVPLLVAGLGDLDPGPVLGGYLGALCLAAALVALTQFVGGLARNQVTAFVLGFLVAAAAMFVQVRAVNLAERFTNIARGVLELRDLVFYLGIAAGFAALDAIRLEVAKGGRGSFREVLALIPLPLTIAALTIAGQYIPQRADLTRDRLYSLNQGSLDVLDALTEPIRLQLYFSERLPARFGPLADLVVTLAEQYDDAGGDRVTLEIVDPDSDPEMAEEARALGIEKTIANTTTEGRIETVSIWFGIALVSENRQEVFPSVGSIANIEYDLTSAILRLSKRERPRVVLLGPTHAEAGGVSFSVDGDMKPLYRELRKLYRVSQIAVTAETAIDLADVDAVFAWGLPYFSESQLYALDQYIVSGGQLTLLVSGMRVDPHILLAQALLGSRADEFYDHLGFRATRTLVSDNNCTKIKYTNTRPPVLESYTLFPELSQRLGGLDAKHSATTYLDTLVLPWSSALEVSVREGIRAHIIGRTSEEAWIQEEDWVIDPKSVPGPSSFDRYTLGLALEGRFDSFFDAPPEGLSDPDFQREGSVPTTVLVWGSEHVLTQANQSSILQWATHSAGFMSHRNQLGDVDRRENAFSPIRETDASEKRRIRWLSVTVVPAIILALALVRAHLRKRRHQRFCEKEQAR